MSSAVRVLLGERCLACRRPGPPLCGDCARRLPAPGPPPAVAGVDRIVTAWAYEGVVRSLLLRLKVAALAGAADPLAGGMSAAAVAAGICPDAVTWVPCRRRDRRRRGFDHAELLARRVASDLGRPCLGLLARCREASDQSGLSRSARAVNLRGVFVAAPCPRHVLLVDDLVTTGATAADCARALRAGGATRVELLTGARA